MLPSSRISPASRKPLLTDRERSRYSISRAILSAIADREGAVGYSNSFEMEVSAEIERSLPSSVKKHGGIFIPFEARTALNTQTTGSGRELVYTEPGPFIEFLYSKMVCRALGAEVLDGLQGNVGFPKQTGKVTGAWVAENPGADATDSNLTTAQIPMSPKTYCATTSFSRQLLAQSTPRIDAIVTKDLATDAAVSLDQAALIGTGAAAHMPVGIVNTTGTQVYVLAGDTGNGAKPTFADLCAMVELAELANADTLAALGWTTNPIIATALRQTSRSTSIMLPAWTDNDALLGFPARVSNQIPRSLSIGTGTNLSLLIFGAWDSLCFGLWGAGFELVVDPFTLKKQNMIELTSFVFGDVAVRQPAAFVVAKNVSKT